MNFIKFIKNTKKFHKYLDFLNNMGYNVNKLNNTTQFFSIREIFHMIRKKYYIAFSPIIVIIVMCIFYAIYGIFPFGSKTVAWCDLKQQTIPLLMNLKDILDGKSSLLYTSASGGGMNFWGVFFFFLASPFYLAVKFIEKHNIIYLVNILLILKLAASSFTASFYIASTGNNLKRKYVVLLGLVYAFCGYGLMYYQTLVWLDIMCLFPLLVLSVDKLCIKQKPYMFIILLSLSFIINYYLSFMIIIYLMFSVPLYIILRCRSNERKKVSLLFLSSMFLCALLTSPVWLCSFIQIKKSARGLNNFSSFLYQSFFESIKDKLCIIGAGAFLIAVLIFLIKSAHIRKNNIKYNILLLGFLLIPAIIDPINKMWHAGGYQSFPMRFGYITVFTMIILASQLLEVLQENNKHSVFFTIFSVLLLFTFITIVIYIIINKKDILSDYTDSLWISDELFKTLSILFLLALFIYFIYFLLIRKKMISSKIFFILISGMILTETFVNLTVYVGNASNNDELFERTINLENKIEEDQYYRVKSEKKYVHVNMIGGLGLNSLAHYTSLTPENYMFAMKKLGYSSYWMEVGANGGTVLTDALLGIKYTIGAGYDFKSYQKNLNINDILGAAENEICCPIGIISKTDPDESSELKFTDRFDIQKQISKCLLGSDDMLIKYGVTSILDGELQYTNGKYNINESDPEISRCRLNYNFKVRGHQNIYFDLFDNLGNNLYEYVYNSVKVTVNGVCISPSYPDKKNNGILDLGEFENEDVDIIVTLLKDISAKSFGVFGIDIDKLINATDRIKTTEPNINGNEITVICSGKQNDYLYLAVPWDSGLKAYLNGTKTKLYKVNDSFCAIKLKDGENNIKIKFYPVGLKISIVFMTFGILLSILLFSNIKITENRRIGTISFLLCKIGLASVILFIYIIPIIVYSAGLIIRLGA